MATVNKGKNFVVMKIQNDTNTIAIVTPKALPGPSNNSGINTQNKEPIPENKRKNYDTNKDFCPMSSSSSAH
ncbi:hypothetical protein RR46_01477 [Papilio xuthus]|uniref:Uncharacterized protein n=1 Tax=Papilio xuthus TaxID=66420 RepID=A0A0N1IA14_PAPXU|nr:hypothetical protein RR46_01477 [Papilio xuthus]